MADDRISLPSGSGGLINYSKDSHSRVEIKPGTVIFLVILIIIFQILLHNFGKGLIGQ